MSTNAPASINQLLAALPESEYQRLTPHLQTVQLIAGNILYQPNEIIEYIYFPNQGMISVVSMMENGATTEVGIVGKEGMVGLPIILGGNSSPHLVIVQIADSAIRLPAELLKQEFDRGGALQQILLLYTQARLTQVAQTAACNRQHVIEKKLARWLLSVQDRLEVADLPLTQELIADMLGVRRSGINRAANLLQRRNMIRYSRGHITIVDRSALEQASCECYRLIKNEFQRLLMVDPHDEPCPERSEGTDERR